MKRGGEFYIFDLTSHVRFHVRFHARFYVFAGVSCAASTAMACQLSDIVGIMDMDGFLINKRFNCKELGLMRVGDVTARSFFFYTGLHWRDLTVKERKTCQYVSVCATFISYHSACLGRRVC